MRQIKTILHPTDFSQNSGTALELACWLARDRSARLLLLHVVPNAPAVFWGEDLMTPPLGEHVEEDIQSYLKEMQQRLNELQVPGPGIPVKRYLRGGAVPEVIVRIAEEDSCDLIVMGTRGQTGPARHMMGSVAEEVTRKAPCPVLTVSIPFQDKQVAESPVAEATCRVS
jgi:nucleotide-binding universal stress UspA family protein